MPGGPLAVMNSLVVHDVIADCLASPFRNEADLEAADRDAPVRAVPMRILPRAGDQMEAALLESTMLGLRALGAEIARSYQPHSGEVGVKLPHQRVGERPCHFGYRLTGK